MSHGFVSTSGKIVPLSPTIKIIIRSNTFQRKCVLSFFEGDMTAFSHIFFNDQKVSYHNFSFIFLQNFDPFLKELSRRFVKKSDTSNKNCCFDGGTQLYPRSTKSHDTLVWASQVKLLKKIQFKYLLNIDMICKNLTMFR